jgi:hypothetical protein
MIDKLEYFLFPVGLFILAVYFYKVWKRPLAPDVSAWEKGTHNMHLGYAVTAILGGIICLIISIIHACTGWVAK